MKSYCSAQGTVAGLLGWNMMEDSKKKKKKECMGMSMCGWVTLLYSRN